MIIKLQFLIKKISNFNFFSAVNFFQFLVIKTLEPDRIGIQPKMLYPDSDSMNPDPKHCFKLYK
jgi:hypothetical protein